MTIYWDTWKARDRKSGLGAPRTLISGFARRRLPQTWSPTLLWIPTDSLLPLPRELRVNSRLLWVRHIGTSSPKCASAYGAYIYAVLACHALRVSSLVPVFLHVLNCIVCPPHILCISYPAFHYYNLMNNQSNDLAVSNSSDLVYEAALVFWKTVTNIFFREIRPRGAFNIPRNGPVIFVVAPHHNQVSPRTVVHGMVR